MRIDIALPAHDSKLSAIHDASALLSEALGSQGHAARVTTLKGVDQDAEVVGVAYNPFIWARWGFAPSLLRTVAALRRVRQRPKLVLMVHEPYVPVRNARTLVMGGWQRAQLLGLMWLVDVRFASIEPWARRLSRVRTTHHLPSGSNVPDARRERERTRAELPAGDAFVVATLSTGHPSHLTGYVEEALRRLRTLDREIVLLQLGAGAKSIEVPRGIRVERPGFVPAVRLGSLIAASDLLLTPFLDGVSTRRGSLMAGLCEEVAVLGTSGPLTDPMLVGRGLELVRVGEPAAYADRAVRLATDDRRRSEAARAGRSLFEAEFTWDAIAARFLEGIEGA